jgi:hypothetical protein
MGAELFLDWTFITLVAPLFRLFGFATASINILGIVSRIVVVHNSLPSAHFLFEDGATHTKPLVPVEHMDIKSTPLP